MNRVFLCVFALFVGCARPATPMVPSKDMDNLHALGDAYLEMLRAGKPPASAAAVRPFLEKLGDPDAILTSPEDGQPYVVIWDVDWRATPTTRMPPPIIAHQRDGKNGRRHVLTVMGVQTLTDAEFASADFISKKRK